MARTHPGAHVLQAAVARRAALPSRPLPPQIRRLLAAPRRTRDRSTPHAQAIIGTVFIVYEFPVMIYYEL